MINRTRLAANLGLAAVLGGLITGGLVTAIPAQAQDSHVRRDIADVRRDQRKLDDLYNQRDRAAERDDWRCVQRVDRQIADLQRHIDLDRRDIRGDIRRSDSYSRDYSRDRYTGDDYRYRDSSYSRSRDSGSNYRNRDGGSSYRNRENNDYNSNRDGDSSYRRDH